MKKKGTLLHKDAPFQGGVPTTWRGRAHQSTRRPGGAISLRGSLLQFGKSRTPMPSLTREHSRRPGQQLGRAVEPSGPWLCPADGRSSCIPERGPGTETGQQGPCSPQACVLCGTPRTAGSCDGRKCLVSLSLVGHAVLSTHAAAALPRAALWGRPRYWSRCVSPFVVLSTPGDSDTQTNAENCGKETGRRLHFWEIKAAAHTCFRPIVSRIRSVQDSPGISSATLIFSRYRHF